MAQLPSSSTEPMQPTGLLELPEACLLAVMQHCKEPVNLLSAARAHSSLRTAAAAAIPAVSLDIKRQRQLRSLNRFLAAHSQHVRHLNLRGGDDEDSLYRFELPASGSLQLHSLALQDLRLSSRMFSAGMHTSGVLAGQSCLTKLVLDRCVLPVGSRCHSVSETLATVLRQLPSLQHLKVVAPVDAEGIFITFPGEVLAHLQGLTCLELNQGTVDGSQVLQHISALTALQDLHFCRDAHLVDDVVDPDDYQKLKFMSDTLGALSCLTSLRLHCCVSTVELDPRALANKPHMQHLELPFVRTFVGGQPGLDTAGLLAELQHKEQLTHLDLTCILGDIESTAPPATLYAALTASSRLQYLGLSSNFFPAGTWRQLFGPSKRLPQLRVLDISRANFFTPPDASLTPADTSCLVRCCPGLQQLTAYGTLHDADTAVVLSSLSSLSSLHIGDRGPWASFYDSQGLEWSEALAALTGLQDLNVRVELYRGEQLAADLLLLTRLQCLTRLRVYDADGELLSFECKEPGQMPVWQQLQLPHDWAQLPP